MKLDGSYRFEVPRERLWETLMDPGAVRECVPGVRSFDIVAPDHYEIEVSVRVGVVSGSYKATLEVVERTAPASYRMVVQGSGARTNVRGEGGVALTAEEDGATMLAFDGDVQVTGVLARAGQRLMSNVAKTQIDRFFKCLESKAAGA